MITSVLAAHAPAGRASGRAVWRRAVALALLGMAVAAVSAGTVLKAFAEPLSLSIGVDLEERNDSGVTGTAKLEAVDGVTWVTITIEAPEGQYLPYLHAGTCDAFRASPAIPLALAVASTPAATAVDIPLDELTSADYVIDVHAAGETIESLLDPATSVACGVVGTSAGPEPAAGNGEIPPAAGIGPLDSGRDWLLLCAAALCAGSLVLSLSHARRPEIRPAPIIFDPSVHHGHGRGVSR